MNKEIFTQEGILKEEKVGYLKSKINLLQGKLSLTSKRLVLEAHKTTIGGGILGGILKRKVEKKDYGFNLEFSKIQSFQQGKQGLNKMYWKSQAKKTKAIEFWSKNMTIGLKNLVNIYKNLTIKLNTNEVSKIIIFRLIFSICI